MQTSISVYGLIKIHLLPPPPTKMCWQVKTMGNMIQSRDAQLWQKEISNTMSHASKIFKSVFSLTKKPKKKHTWDFFVQSKMIYSYSAKINLNNLEVPHKPVPCRQGFFQLLPPSSQLWFKVAQWLKAKVLRHSEVHQSKKQENSKTTVMVFIQLSSVDRSTLQCFFCSKEQKTDWRWHAVRFRIKPQEPRFGLRVYFICVSQKSDLTVGLLFTASSFLLTRCLYKERQDRITAPSCLLLSPRTCCTGCLSSGACPTKWRWRRSSQQSSCGGSHGSGCRRRMGSSGAGSKGCRNHWERERARKLCKLFVQINPYLDSILCITNASPIRNIWMMGKTLSDPVGMLLPCDSV